MLIKINEGVDCDGIVNKLKFVSHVNNVILLLARVIYFICKLGTQIFVFFCWIFAMLGPISTVKLISWNTFLLIPSIARIIVALSLRCVRTTFSLSNVSR